MSVDSNSKLTAAQLTLILHLHNGEGKIVDDNDQPMFFVSADGSQKFTVRDITVVRLLHMGVLRAEYRGACTTIYRLSTTAQQLIALTF